MAVTPAEASPRLSRVSDVAIGLAFVGGFSVCIGAALSGVDDRAIETIAVIWLAIVGFAIGAFGFVKEARAARINRPGRLHVIAQMTVPVMMGAMMWAPALMVVGALPKPVCVAWLLVTGAVALVTMRAVCRSENRQTAKSA